LEFPLLNAQITGNQTPLSNSIKSHYDRSKAPEEFTNHPNSPTAPVDLTNSSLNLTNSSLDLTNSSLDLRNSRLDLTQSPSHKATSAAQMQTNLQSIRQSRSDLLCRPVIPRGAGGAMEPPEFCRSVCETPLSNSIESHSDRSKAPEEFRNHTISPTTPLDSSLNLSNSSLDLTNSRLDLTNSRVDLTNSRADLTQSSSHKATSSAQMQTNLQSVRQSRSDLLCSAIGRFENPGVPVLFGGHNLLPLVEIGLMDLPKSGGAPRATSAPTTPTAPMASTAPTAPPAPLGMTGLLCDNSLGQPSSNIISSNSNDDPEDKSTSIISLDISLEGKFQKWCQNLYKALQL
jgi:hypothetical protein